MPASSTAGAWTDAAIRLTDIACFRGGRTLFSGVSLALGRGDVCQVTGPNGCGKSSLIRLVAGLLTPSAGSVDRRGAIALADERLALDMELPLIRALAFWAGLDGATLADIERAIVLMDLEMLAEIPVRIFSTGQRKRALLARIIASKAPIWLLDEPANGLDSASIDRLGAAIAAHRKAGGIVLAASHQPLPLEAPILLPIQDFAPSEALR